MEKFLEWGGMKKDIVCLVLSAIALVCSLLGFQPFPFDIAWVAIRTGGRIFTGSSEHMAGSFI